VGDEAGWISGNVFTPDVGTSIRRVVLFCFPGDGKFSFARAMTARGFTCVTLDHPGTGESFVPADGFGLDAAAIAVSGAAAMKSVAQDLRAGRVDSSLPPMDGFACVGVGHSMGAMIVTMQQAAAPLYDGAALLCFTTRGLPEVLTADEQAVAMRPARGPADFAQLAQARFGEPFPDIAPVGGESAASRALAAVAGRLAATAAMQSMLPGNVAREAASLTVPLFLSAGERDLTGPPHAIPAAFSGCNDLRLVVVPGAGHHPFVTEGAPRLYQSLADWINTIVVAA